MKCLRTGRNPASRASPSSPSTGTTSTILKRSVLNPENGDPERASMAALCLKALRNSCSGSRRGLFSFISRGHVDGGFAQGDDGSLAGIGLGMAGTEGNFFLHKVDKLLHFPIHLFHALPHLQN